MRLPRRAALAAPLILPGIARAQQQRPIVIVVPYAPGGGTDVTAREFAQGFSEALGGATVVVENRGGAGGHLGSVSVARSRPDGTTLLFAVSTNLVVNPHLHNDNSNLVSALTPVAQVSAYQYLLVIDPRLPPQNLAEFIPWVRAQPAGELTYSSGGVGNANHLAGVLFSDVVGIRMEHVPYRGTGPALLDVVAGRISMNFSSPPPAIALAREGRLRPIAVTGERRMAAIPDVPTLTEAGLGAATVTGWHGVFAPAATPPEIMARYEAAARQAAANPRFANRLEPDGLEPAPQRSRAEFQAAIRAEHDFWGRKIREQGLRLE